MITNFLRQPIFLFFYFVLCFKHRWRHHDSFLSTEIDFNNYADPDSEKKKEKKNNNEINLKIRIMIMKIEKIRLRGLIQCLTSHEELINQDM